MATAALHGLVAARIAIAEIEGDLEDVGEPWSKEQLSVFRAIELRLKEMIAADMEIER